MAKSKKGKTAAAAKNGGIGKKSLTKTASTSTINDTSATKVTTTTTVTSPISPPTSSIHLYDIAFYVFILVSFMYATIYAYNIRLHAIREYGPVIHEFDPYFNYRATEYLYYNGREKFFTWFDHQSWYPLGRPVGTTIYPGMQFTAVFIKNYIVGDTMSLNDVCCYIPAWFGVIASLLVGLITYECSLGCNTNTHVLAIAWNIIVSILDLGDDRKIENRKNGDTAEQKMQWKIACICAAISTVIMAIAPAHLMRSVGGGFDNESVAISAMTMTFYFWVRSLRNGDDYSFLFGILTGIAYFYMVATWGGYVFVLNMIGVHAAILVAMGRFTTKVYLSFSLFYVIGTALAIQIPVVGLTPLKSLEQLSCLVIFIIYQVLFIAEKQVKKRKLSGKDAWKSRRDTYLFAGISGMILIAFFLPSNYFGPISSRVRGLFVRHTKTGNPLVDSVAEHQPAKSNAYYQYLHQLCMFAPFGFSVVMVYFGDSPSFLCAYAAAAYYFSRKMVRLILLAAPICSILAGIAAGRILVWSLQQIFNSNDTTNEKKHANIFENQPQIKQKKGSGSAGVTPDLNVDNSLDTKINNFMKRVTGFVLILMTYASGSRFMEYSWSISTHLSNPSIIQRAKLKSGAVVHIDDYREAYWWIRDNTPQDARIMAWWDYGYQLASIANRTTIADGNTWNHEHIALLGKIYTTNVDEAHSIARHLADYILVWAGGGGDDLAKSPHIARVANSVYRDLCPNDPVCSTFTLVRAPPGTDRKYHIREGLIPSPQMQASLVNHLVADGQRGIKVDPNKFKEVFRSKYAKARVFKIIDVDEESKAWVADPKSKICDAQGSWFCRGQYPPALQEALKKGKNFVQLEDFNKKDEDSDFQKLYHEGLATQREKHAQKAKKQQSSQGDL